MKKAILSLFLCLGLCGAAVADMHDPPGAAYGRTRKLGRGIANLVLGALELPYTIAVCNSRYGNQAAVSYGLVEGAGRSASRIAWGLWETFYFLVPTYKGSYRIQYDTPYMRSNGALAEFPPTLIWEDCAGFTRQTY